MLILFLGNCQMYCIMRYVSQYLNDDNNKYMSLNIVRDLSVSSTRCDDLIKSSDLIISQHMYSKDRDYSDERIKSLAKCNIIYVHCLYFTGYFPDIALNLAGMRSIMSPTFPRYETPYLDSLILQNLSNEKILEELNIKFNTEFVIINLNKTLNNLHEREDGCNGFNRIDVPIYDFIKNNYHKHHIFWCVNHPSNYMLNYYSSKIASYILNRDILFNKDILCLKELLGSYSTPIYDSVKSILKLEFSTEYSNTIIKQKITFFEYIEILRESMMITE